MLEVEQQQLRRELWTALCWPAPLVQQPRSSWRWYSKDRDKGLECNSIRIQCNPCLVTQTRWKEERGSLVKVWLSCLLVTLYIALSMASQWLPGKRQITSAWTRIGHWNDSSSRLHNCKGNIPTVPLKSFAGLEQVILTDVYKIRSLFVYCRIKHKEPCTIHRSAVQNWSHPQGEEPRECGRMDPILVNDWIVMGVSVGKV